MVSSQFIVFKCKVNICNQDLGSYCREWDLETKKYFGEEEQATEQTPEDVLEALVGRTCGVSRFGWWFWPASVIIEVGGWWCELRSLLGQLWRDWVFWRPA